MVFPTPQSSAFQSHAGSIEASLFMTSSRSTPMFQSHAGSIEAGAPGSLGVERDCRFNPTLVRLRLRSSALCDPQRTRFQSHAGSIEADAVEILTLLSVAFQSHAGSIEARRSKSIPICWSWFQSHAGSIEAPQQARRATARYPVSIPRWFD